jgi:ribulose-phosphate 3-epimerase
MAEIIPAILPKHFLDLKEKIELAVGRTQYVHIDVTDGTLTENSNWPYAKENVEFDRLRKEESGFPFWEDLHFEAHLMVKDVEGKYEEWVRAGIERLIVHIESFDTSEELSEFLLKLQKHFSLRDSDFGIEVGLGVNLSTPISEVLHHVLECDFVHFMSVKDDGMQGEVFEEEIFDKIKELRSEYPEVILAVDGGVSLMNAKRLLEAGVERLVVGSAIYAADNPDDALEELILETQ